MLLYSNFVPGAKFTGCLKEYARSSCGVKFRRGSLVRALKKPSSSE